MAAIDIEEEYKSLQALFENVEEPYDEMIKVVCNFLADFAERAREAQMRSDIDYLYEQGYNEASSKLLLSGPFIEINKGDVK